MVRCMVVDDSAYARALIRRMLETHGHEIVAEAEDGEIAVEMFKKHRPDLVTMDVLMPNKDGIEATKEIVEVDPKCKIIVCSSLKQDRFIEEAREAGASDFIIKPFGEIQLTTRINSILGIQREQKDA